MIGALGADELVAQHLAALPLHQLLKGGLVIAAGALLRLPVQDELLDELPGRADAAVQVHGGQHRLHRVGNDGGPLPAAAGLLPLAQLQVGAQLQALGHFHQAALTHQGRPGAGQIPFRQVGVGAEQVVGHDHTKHRVPQKFQPLIALQSLGLVLVGVGAVGEGVFQKGPVGKPVTQLFFQCLHGRSSLSKPEPRREAGLLSLWFLQSSSLDLR